MTDTSIGVAGHGNSPVPAAPTPDSGRTVAERGRRRRARVEGPGLPWLIPTLVLSVGLLYYCIGYTGYISTLNWDGVSPSPPSVGFGNYIRMWHDPVFWKAIRHTILFFVVTFVGQTFLGLMFAVLLHTRVMLGAVYKVIIFIPVVLAPAIMAPVFRHIFSPTGEFNAVLKALGLGSLAQPWIGQTSTAIWVIMGITIWQWTGLTFVLYFAAMTQVDQSTIEAARIDGAGNLRVLASIVWPSLRGTTIALGILSVIGALKTFDVPWLVTIAGPDNATQFLGTYIYQETVQLNHLGYAGAMAVVLLVIALTVAIAIRVIGRERRS